MQDATPSSDPIKGQWQIAWVKLCALRDGAAIASENLRVESKSAPCSVNKTKIKKV